MRDTPPPAPGSPARSRGALRGPLALTACLHVLAATFILVTWCLDPPTPAVRWLAQRLYRRPPPARASVMVSVYLVQQPDGRFVAVDDSGSGDPIAALAQTDAGHILEGIYWEAGWSQGLWAPWRRSHSQTVGLRGLPRHPTDADTVSAERAAAARETFAQWFEQKGSPRYAARVREGTRKRLDFVWWGPVLDAFSVALLVGTLVSAWTTIQSTRAARRAARLRDGSCPACHYDLRPVSDSALEVRCPECGRVWSRQTFGSGG